MNIRDSLDTLYSEADAAFNRREEAKNQYAAYKKELAELNAEYQEYFDKLAALKDRYQLPRVQSDTGIYPTYRFMAFTVCELTKRLCNHYLTLSDDEQEELEAAMDGYDIDFCMPEKRNIDWLDATYDEENGFSVHHQTANGPDFIVLETQLSFQKLFEVMRLLLPAEFFSAPGDYYK